MALTKLNNNSLHAITDGSALKNVTGTVLQVKQTVVTSVISLATSTGAWHDVPSLSVSITPKSSNSDILVSVKCEVGSNANGNLSMRLVRGSTAIGIGDAVSSANRSSFSAANRGTSASEAYGVSFQFLDSPSTTSATTYKVQHYNNWNTTQIYLGRPHNSLSTADDEAYPSIITVMEIAG